MRPPITTEYVAAQHAQTLRDAESAQLQHEAGSAVGGAAPQLRLRTLGAADLDHVVALFERLSPRSRYLRYLAPVRSLSDRVQRRLVSVDHVSHEAVGAFEAGVLVGAAHYFRSADDPAQAEVSVEVADSHQRHGVGRRLLDDLAHRARGRGIAQFTATVLRENSAAIALLGSVDRAAAVRFAGTELTVAVDLAVITG